MEKQQEENEPSREKYLESNRIESHSHGNDDNDVTKKDSNKHKSKLTIFPRGRGHFGKIEIVVGHVKGFFFRRRSGLPSGRARKTFRKQPIGAAFFAVLFARLQIPQQLERGIDQPKGFGVSALVGMVRQDLLVVALLDDFEFFAAIAVAAGKYAGIGNSKRAKTISDGQLAFRGALFGWHDGGGVCVCCMCCSNNTSNRYRTVQYE